MLAGYSAINNDQSLRPGLFRERTNERAKLMKIAAHGALFLSGVTSLAGGEENDRILVLRLLRLFSFLIFLPQKKNNKELFCNSGVEFSLEAKQLSDV